MPLFTITSRELPLRPVLGSGILAVLLLLAPAAQAASGPAHPVPYHGDDAPDAIVAGTMPENYLPGLMDLVHVALSHGPTMIVQQIQVAQAEANLLNSDSTMYPHVGASGSYGVSNESVGQAGQFGAAGSHSTGNSTAESYGIGASMPVFQWGAVWNQTRIAKLALLISRKSYAEAYRNFVVGLRDSYLALVAEKIGLRNAEFGLKITEDSYALAQSNLKNGMIANGAVEAPKLAAEDARLNFDRLQANYSHAKRVLAQLAGVPDLADDSIPTDLPKVTYVPATADAVLAAFLRDGAKSTFQAENYEMAVRQAVLGYRIALTAPLPKFTAGYNYNATDESSIALASVAPGQPATPASIAKVGVVATSYSINASWNIFDGFQTAAGIRSAKASRRMAERQLQTYLEVTLETGQDYRRQVDLSARAMALAETRRELAASALDQTVVDYKYGSSPQSAVDAAKYNLYINEQSLVAARSDFLSHWSAFVSLVGADPALGLLPLQYVRAIR